MNKEIEIKIRIENSEELINKLKLLGFSYQRILEKKRQVWEKNGQKIIELLVDELPFGN